jgi:hypothetical protein
MDSKNGAENLLLNRLRVRIGGDDDRRLDKISLRFVTLSAAEDLTRFVSTCTVDVFLDVVE